MQETITKSEKEAVAELRNHAGFQVLLGFFERELGIIQDLLLSNTDPAIEPGLVARWKEFKRVYVALKTYPEVFAEDLASMNLDIMAEPYTPEYKEEVFADYRKKLAQEFTLPRPTRVVN